jgi:hypothetical protein
MGRSRANRVGNTTGVVVEKRMHFGGEKSSMMMVGSLVEKTDYAYLGISQSSANTLIGSGRGCSMGKGDRRSKDQR